MLVFLELILGLLILIVGGELLVKGAVNFARYFQVSPLIIGLTIVSFGTSAPELLVSLRAAIMDSPQMAIGNVVGSNIANLALVLGATVLISPIKINKSKLFLNWSVMLFATLLFVVFSVTEAVLAFWEGCILFSALIVFLLYSFFYGTNENDQFEEESSKSDLLISLLLFLPFGAFGLNYGAGLLIDSAKTIALTVLHISESVVAVTIVAFGTSLPELVASCVAAYRNQPGLSIGNLIGSNIFNLLAVLGLTSIVVPVAIYDSFFSFDVYWLLAITLLIGPILFFSKKIGRIMGILLFAFYVAYILFVL